MLKKVVSIKSKFCIQSKKRKSNRSSSSNCDKKPNRLANSPKRLLKIHFKIWFKRPHFQFRILFYFISIVIPDLQVAQYFTTLSLVILKIFKKYVHSIFCILCRILLFLLGVSGNLF